MAGRKMSRIRREVEPVMWLLSKYVGPKRGPRRARVTITKQLVS